MTFSSKLGCPNKATFFKDLSHPFESACLLVTCWKIQRLGGSIWKLAIGHEDALLQDFAIYTMDRPIAAKNRDINPKDGIARLGGELWHFACQEGIIRTLQVCRGIVKHK